MATKAISDVFQLESKLITAVRQVLREELKQETPPAGLDPSFKGLTLSAIALDAMEAVYGKVDWSK